MKRFIKSLNKKYSNQEIETTIIDQYIKKKNFSKNKFFTDYFNKYPSIEDKKVLNRFMYFGSRKKWSYCI